MSRSEDTFTSVKQLPVYSMALFPIFCNFVCVHSQFGSGSYLNIWVPVDPKKKKKRNHSIIPKIIGYLCPNWSGIWYIEGIYSQDEVS